MERAKAKKSGKKSGKKIAVVQRKKIIVKKNTTHRKGEPKARGQMKEVVRTIAPKGIILQRGSFMKQTGSKGPGSVRLTGHEFLAAIDFTPPPGIQSNNVCYNWFINPSNLIGTRLSTLARCYEKYFFRKVTLHFNTASPTTSSGQYGLAVDTDYADQTPDTTTQGTREFFSMKNSKMATVYESVSLTFVPADPQNIYYVNDTGYEGRIVFQGQFYLFSLFQTAVKGSLWLEYDCELYEPQMETQIQQFVVGSNTVRTVQTCDPSFTYINAPIRFNGLMNFLHTVMSNDRSYKFIEEGTPLVPSGFVLGNGKFVLEVGVKPDWDMETHFDEDMVATLMPLTVDRDGNPVLVDNGAQIPSSANIAEVDGKGIYYVPEMKNKVQSLRFNIDLSNTRGLTIVTLRFMVAGAVQLFSISQMAVRIYRVFEFIGSAVVPVSESKKELIGSLAMDPGLNFKDHRLLVPDSVGYDNPNAVQTGAQQVASSPRNVENNSSLRSAAIAMRNLSIGKNS